MKMNWFDSRRNKILNLKCKILKESINLWGEVFSQLAFTPSKSAVETPEQCVKSIQS